MALGATGERLRSPVLFAFKHEIQKTLAAQSCRQWHPLFERDKTLARFRHPRAKLLLSRKVDACTQFVGSVGASRHQLRTEPKSTARPKTVAQWHKAKTAVPLVRSPHRASGFGVHVGPHVGMTGQSGQSLEKHITYSRSGTWGWPSSGQGLASWPPGT